MKCVIGGAHIKVFGRAIHAMARISDGFWFDPIEKGLSLRAVNSSRSAYACVFFSSIFFQHYSCRNTPERNQHKNHIRLRCKLVIKSVLPLFRCLNTLERNVEKCTIYTDFKDCCIVFQLFCRHGVVKTHNLAFQECEPLQAVFAKHLCPNVLKARSRQLSDILIHFPNYQEEVTLSVTPVKVCFKTYTEDEMDFAIVMHTEIHLSPEEFEYFQVGVDSEITFCLKELRGLIAFAEAIHVPVAVHFDMPGRPVVFSLEDTVVEASFVLATLADTSESLHLSRGQRRSPALESSNQGTVSNRNLQDPETTKNPADNFTITAEAQPSSPGYSKFYSLFFGAISSSEEDVTNALHTLATASDTEDFGN
ncbi:cell cycle checkpoint control protein RAD9B [Sceloporus undulatus]|uniref:cell cycle checkpoint control protein RAD9B n=1 Tax=Sceloporus undulatus TaxID=8520 RepID=UPI001C4C0238|nr:cell cycle checkpoint control protein RAD9B [Sceloporus undulatus]